MRYLYENSPERYAQDVVCSMNLAPPVDIYGICDSYDIKVCFEDICTAEAFLVVTSRRKSIIINERKILYMPRQRFTIAHEVGHLFIPWHTSQCACYKIGNFDTSNATENEADMFASELLIPTASLIPKIEGRIITLELIKELAQEYNVSLGAMTRKVIANTDEMVMALLYYGTGGKIIQAQSRDFDLHLRPGIIQSSAAKELLNSRYGNESMKRILNCGEWFMEANNDFEIVEESMYQPHFSRVFTILRVANDFDYFDAFFR
ncbi:MAG: ImmA/IrrE family metallo-endopeptidase [Clostridiaceae bacterium]|jgi:Zn-dependent peptidase ImmA (M78 family)|nr:ImmA/IrrE family metallo-endopeptidase [Clostridiaceae bacterium]